MKHLNDLLGSVKEKALLIGYVLLCARQQKMKSRDSEMKEDDAHSSKQRDYEMSGMGVIVDMEVRIHLMR